MTTSSAPVDGAADALQVLRNRTFDEIAIGDSASLERAFSPQDIQMFALQSGDDVDPESSVSSLAGHHRGHLCKRPDLGCAGNTPAGAWNPICQPEPALARSRSARRQADRADAGEQQRHGHPSRHAGLHLHQPGGVAVFQGQVEVVAPTERIERTRTALPEIHRMRRATQACNACWRTSRTCNRFGWPSPILRCPSLSAALEARHAGLIEPVLVGSRARLEAVATEAGLDLADVAIVDVPHSHAAAQQAVALAAAGEVEALMKGSLHTDELMSALVSAAAGLRTKRRVSHCFLLRHRPIRARSSSPMQRSISPRLWNRRQTSSATPSSWRR